MGAFLFVMFLLIILALVQTFLSLRNNRLLGLIIPGMNAFAATGLGMMGSDYFIGYMVFVLFLMPIVFWLMIYKLCRSRVMKKKEKDMKKLKVKEL